MRRTALESPLRSLAVVVGFASSLAVGCGMRNDVLAPGSTGSGGQASAQGGQGGTSGGGGTGEVDFATCASLLPSQRFDCATCANSLANVRMAWQLDCPDAFVEAQTWINDCASLGASGVAPSSRSLGTCEGSSVVRVGWGTHDKRCFYDPATGALIGAAAGDDQPSYCGGTSYNDVGGVAALDCTGAGAQELGSCSTTSL